MSPAAVALGVKALVRAARRADARGDVDERDQLLVEADEQVGVMIAAMPPDEPRGR